MNNHSKHRAITTTVDDIAVIGMAGRFPGAQNIQEFWLNLQAGKDSIYRFSDWELKQAGVSEKLIDNPRYVKARGILDNIEQFDADFFGISPYDAAIMDPQHRLFLEVCWEALDAAGYSSDTHKQMIGVFAGMSDNSYLENCLLKNSDFLKDYSYYQAQIANSIHFLATKVSYYLNLKGPSLNISTACSTSLVSIIQACQSLIMGDCDIAIAGGVSIRVPQIRGYLYQEGGIFSENGQCRAFDAKATGTVSANAVGVVVLKKLQDALRDEDNIDAVIKSYAVNNDGAAKAGYFAPSILEQARCIAMALTKVHPESISYIEAHGTGTLIGDPIEIAALTKAFRHYTKKKNYCAIGSVKTNIGHADVAAGVVGFIKTVLCLQNKVIPTSLHCEVPNPHIAWWDSPFYVNRETIFWPMHGDHPRTAGVSSFGIGGTNAHIILEESIDQKRECSVLEPTFSRQKYWIDPDHNIALVSNSPVLYEPYWELNNLNLTTQVALLSKKDWLIFSDQFDIAIELIQCLTANKQNIICVTQGKKFKELKRNHYEINPKSKADYVQLFDVLCKKNKLPNYFIYGWSVSGNKKNRVMKGDDFWYLIYFAQTFLHHALLVNLSIIILVDFIEKILQDDALIPIKATVMGACITIPQEYPGVRCRAIDIGSDFKNLCAKNIMEDAVFPASECFLAYRNGVRLVKKFRPFLNKFYHKEMLLKSQGVYLILGGTGNIGLELARFLAEKYQAHLWLVSRSLPVADKEQELHAIKTYAASMNIVQADVSCYDSMKNLFADIKKKSQQCDGIFYLAGVLDMSTNTLIENLSFKKVTEQFASKIQGVQVLRRLRRDISANFCILFSSVATVLGGIGLSAYAAANCYLDAVAADTNDDKTHWLSINWDAWDFVSPQPSAAKTIKSKLQPAMAIACLDNNFDLFMRRHNIIVTMESFNDRLQYWVNPVSEGCIDQLQNVQKSHNVEEKLKDIFSICLGIRNINFSDKFYDLGGDSLAAIRLIEMIQSTFSVPISLSALVSHDLMSLSHMIKNQKLSVIPSCLVNLKNKGNKSPIFLIHPVSGMIFCYSELVTHLPKASPCYGLQDPSIESTDTSFTSVEDMAHAYLQVIRSAHPNGPYWIVGYSFGANVAFEIVKQLEAAGEKVQQVFLIDGWAISSKNLKNYDEFQVAMQSTLNEMGANIPAFVNKQRLLSSAWQRMQLLFHYRPQKIHATIVLFKAKKILPEYMAIDDAGNHWSEHSYGKVKIYKIDGDHRTILTAKNAMQIGHIFAKIFKE